MKQLNFIINMAIHPDMLIFCFLQAFLGSLLMHSRNDFLVQVPLILSHQCISINLDMLVANINKNCGKSFYEMIENLMICHLLLIKKVKQIIINVVTHFLLCEMMKNLMIHHSLIINLNTKDSNKGRCSPTLI